MVFLRNFQKSHTSDTMFSYEKTNHTKSKRGKLIIQEKQALPTDSNKAIL